MGGLKGSAQFLGGLVMVDQLDWEVVVPSVLGREVVAEVKRLAAGGYSYRSIARMAGCSAHGVVNVLERARLRPARWEPAVGRLSLSDREEIRAGLVGVETLTAIAGRLGCSVSTVSREVAANGGRGGYRAWAAHIRAEQRARRPKVCRLAHQPLVEQVTEWLLELWSPEEIARRLRLEFASDPMMQVSHETIYQSLFVQGRGELRRELHRCLRSGRAHRRSRPELANGTGQIPGMVNISERPAEVEDRAVPGHWEGDLIMGRNNRSAVGTLVERSTRYVLLLHLPNGRNADAVNEAMKTAIGTLPAELVRTITWDQGSEMSHHARFTIDTGIQIYFCDPRSPWQRGSNENTNGLLRQYMPKGTNLAVHTADDLARFQRSLNNRPRETLGYMKPSEKLAELLALTP
jgi:IS30 family transposase